MTTESHNLIEQSQGLVRSLALKIHGKLPRSIPLDDLIGYGQVGLAQAANAFDPSAGNAFATFAFYRIRGAIYDGLAKMTGCPRRLRRRLRFEGRAVDYFEDQSQLASSGDDLIAHCRWLVETSQQLAVVYLAAAAELPVDGQLSPDRQVESQEIVHKLRQIIAALPEPDQTVIRLVYYDGWSLADVAKRFGKDKSWASRAHARVLSQLARQLKVAGAA